MRHLVFVYGTLLAGEANHHLLAGAELLGPHRTEPCFTMLALGAYPGVVRGGSTALAGEIYRINDKSLERLDLLEDYPRLYDRTRIPSSYGRAWIYLFRGRISGRAVIRSGDWRFLSADIGSIRVAAGCTARNRKNPRWRGKFG